ncbi:hypothetical protein ACFL0H_08900 [Thermodesulfobacteriota bacterium]
MLSNIRLVDEPLGHELEAEWLKSSCIKLSVKKPIRLGGACPQTPVAIEPWLINKGIDRMITQRLT